jgi:Ca-activated chloride channel family protein
MAAQVGVRVYTVLAGKESGGYGGYRPDGDAASKPLIDIARVTGGKFFRAGDAGTLAEIYREIDKLEKTKMREDRYESYTERFRPFATLGAMLLLFAAISDHTWLRRLP